MAHNLNYYSRYNRAKKKKHIQSLHQYYFESAPTSLENTFDDMSKDDYYHNISVNPFLETQHLQLIKVEDQASNSNQSQVLIAQEIQRKKSLSQINQLSENLQQEKLQSSQILDDPSELGYQFCVLNCQSRSQVNQSVLVPQNKRKTSFKQHRNRLLDIDYQPNYNEGNSGSAESYDDCSFVRIIDNHLNAQQVSTINIEFSSYRPVVNLTQSFTAEEQQKKPIIKSQVQKKNVGPRLVISTIQGSNRKKSRVNFKYLLRTQSQLKKGQASTVTGQDKKVEQELDIKQKRRKLLQAFFQQN